ncbi:MAG: O-antigen ligase family protein [Flavobacteriales bacterium]
MGKRSPLFKPLWFATLALAAMPVLGMRPMVLVIIIWSVLALVHRTRSSTSARIEWQTIFVLCAPFILMLLDLFRADSFSDGWPFVERSAALAIFPIGFLLFAAPADARTRDLMRTIFTLCGTVLALVVNALMLPYLKQAWEVDASFSSTYRFAFSDISGVHPPYAAYWFLVGALFQVDVLFSAFTKWRPIRSILWRIAVLIVMVVTALFIGSRMPLFAFGAGVVLLLFMRLPRVVAMRSSILVLGLLAAAVLLSPGIRERMGELLPFEDGATSNATMNSVEIRRPITDCSLALLEEHWIMGIGGAEVQGALDTCYASLGLGHMEANGYGPHDQALHWWLSYGILGLTAFALLFGWSMRRAWQRKDALHLSFLLFMLLCTFTEDLLTRQWGVVLFACFNTLFVAGGNGTASEFHTVDPALNNES